MRIFIILHDFKLGGVERIALRLASEWSRLGHDIALFCGTTDGPLRAHVPDRARLIPADPPIERGSRSRLRLGRAAAHYVRDQRPDIIFLPGNYYFEAAIPLKLMVGRPCPPIVGKVSNALHRPGKGRLRSAKYRTWFRIKACFLDVIVTMSEGLRSEARAVVGGRSDKFVTIHEPILHEPAMGISPSVTASTPRLMAAGRLAPQKNMALLIDALARLPRKLGATLDIYGEGPLAAALEAQSDRLGLRQLVRLCGYVPDLKEVMPRYSLFVLSSDYEGFPAVLVEALAAGLPIVATDCSAGIREIVTSEALGRVVPVRDAPALASAIESVLHDPPTDRDAIRAYADPFRLGRSAEAYLALFERVGKRA